ncbi:MAG: 5'/3'-nucleotidase SurE [Thermoleophilia bacterium]|nr:5'/3'-nucleotidase SurE [Thermoleophilia bacterium]
MPHILITNDDGVLSPGLGALLAPLREVGEVHVLAPHANRSAVARALTIHQPLHVRRVDLPDGTAATSCDGTPVDCVRLAALGVLGIVPDAVVSGINHGVNMGDDVTYSGTVGAALEGLMCGWFAVGVSCEARGEPADRWSGDAFDFGPVAASVARLVDAGLRGDVPREYAYNVNSPAELSSNPPVMTATRLGRRIYNDELMPHPPGADGVYYDIYNARPGHHDEEGTDFAAHVRGEISVTPLHLSITAHEGMDALRAGLATTGMSA